MGTTVLPTSNPDAGALTGEIKWVALCIGEDDHTHMTGPEEYMHAQTSKQ